MVAGTAFAHDEAGSAYTLPGQESKEQQFEDVRASTRDSNAPRGFAPCVQGMAADMPATAST